MSFLLNLLPGALKGLGAAVKSYSSGENVGNSLLSGIKSAVGLDNQNIAENLPSNEKMKILQNNKNITKIPSFSNSLGSGNEIRMRSASNNISNELDYQLEEIINKIIDPIVRKKIIDEYLSNIDYIYKSYVNPIDQQIKILDFKKEFIDKYKNL